MHTRNTSRSPWLRRGLLLSALVAALAACRLGLQLTRIFGDGPRQCADPAQADLRQRQARQERGSGITFTLNPSGSSTLSTPSASLSGPFQSRGPAPARSRTSPRDLALGRKGQLGIVSTGAAATSRSRAPPTSCPPPTSSGWSRASPVGRVQPAAWPLGINPLHWLTCPDRRLGHHRRRADHPHPGRRQCHRPAQGRQHAAGQGGPRAPRAPSSRPSPAGDPAEDRGGDQARHRRRLDGQERQGPAQAVAEPQRARDRTALHPGRGDDRGRDRLHPPILRCQPAPDGLRARQRAALQPVHRSCARC